MVRVALHGATGRMGRAIAALCAQADDLDVVGAVAHPDDPAQGRDVGELAGVGPLGVFVSPQLSDALLGADVVIDFSLAPAMDAFLREAVAAKVPVISGTTGLTEGQIGALAHAATQVPLLWARNMSFGIQLLAELVEQAVRRLGADFDVEIVEVHHRNKVDSPSGTALRLADAARTGRAALVTRSARAGQVGARPSSEMGVFGVRGGDVIGDHAVHLLGPGERLELTHRATSRDVFAHGALRAARWIVGKPAGQYEIADVLAG